MTCRRKSFLPLAVLLALLTAALVSVTPIRAADVPVSRESAPKLGASSVATAVAPVSTVRSGEAATPSLDEQITVDLIRRPLAYLAGDEFNGRAAGSDDMRRASQWVADEFKKYGFQPAGVDGTYFQPFEVPRRRVDAEKTSLRITLPEKEAAALELDREFQPFRFSGEGRAEAEVVFAGYGITAEEYDYDDYAGLDVKDKTVLLMRYEPGAEDPASKFEGATNTIYATFDAKVRNAEKHGAAAVIFFTPPRYHEKEGEELYGEHSSARNATTPVFQVTRPQAEAMFKACGQDLAKVQMAIDEKAKPQSFAMTGVRASGAVAFKSEPMKLRNVLGLLPGSDPKLAPETVIVGAHLDHVGRKVADPKKPDEDVIFNGADDNASGVAAMLAIARVLGESKDRPKRSVLFMAFDGEEVGLLGSEHYVAHPLRPLDKTAVMINLDMVGRLDGGRVTVYGVGTAAGFREIADKVTRDLGLKASLIDSGSAPSDGRSFVAAGVPSLFFFTGLHRDYHRVSDEASRIDYEGEAKVTRAALRALLPLANADGRPKFAGAGVSAGTPRNRPMLGLALNLDDDGNVVVGSVVPDSGADKAGLRLGDMIKTIDGQKIDSTEALIDMVQKHKAGDKVKVAYTRGGKEQSVEVTLEARK